MQNKCYDFDKSYLSVSLQKSDRTKCSTQTMRAHTDEQFGGDSIEKLAHSVPCYEAVNHI